MTRLRCFVTTKRPIMSKHTHDGSTRTNIAVARPVLEIYRSVLYRRRIPKQSYLVGRPKNGLSDTPVGVARWRWNLVKFTQLLCRRERSRQIVKISRLVCSMWSCEFSTLSPLIIVPMRCRDISSTSSVLEKNKKWINYLINFWFISSVNFKITR